MTPRCTRTSEGNKSMADSIVDWKDIFKKEDTQ